MRKEAVRYWDEIAAQDLPAVRDAMLAGFRSERAFDESGRIDARHLLLPFVSRGDRVLDVGCGIARLLFGDAVASRPWHASGISPAP